MEDGQPTVETPMAEIDSLDQISEVRAEIISIDEGNGVVVVSTDVPDGQKLVMQQTETGETVSAVVADGQAWFYFTGSIAAHNVHLV